VPAIAMQSVEKAWDDPQAKEEEGQQQRAVGTALAGTAIAVAACVPIR